MLGWSHEWARRSYEWARRSHEWARRSHERLEAVTRDLEAPGTVGGVAVTQQGGLKPRAHEVWQLVLPEAAIVPSGSLSVSSSSRLLRERFARKDGSGIVKGTVVGVA